MNNNKAKQAVTGSGTTNANSLSIQANRTDEMLERLIGINEMIEGIIVRVDGESNCLAQEIKSGCGPMENEGVLSYITKKNDMIDDELSKASGLIEMMSKII